MPKNQAQQHKREHCFPCSNKAGAERQRVLELRAGKACVELGSAGMESDATCLTEYFVVACKAREEAREGRWVIGIEGGEDVLSDSFVNVACASCATQREAAASTLAFSEQIELRTSG